MAQGHPRSPEAVEQENVRTVRQRLYLCRSIQAGYTCKNKLQANGKVFAIFVQETGKADQMYYIHTDHLGSYDMVTNSSAAVAETYAFDAWGYRRKNANWASYETRTSFLFSRGFTGHEHYNGFDIINMNGRLYDPAIGRFFSPDPVVQFPEETQGFNRYSYCKNNPLKYTDPTGREASYAEADPDDGGIYVIAEAGDGPQSLIDFFRGKKSAQYFVGSHAIEDGRTYNEGDRIKMLDNPFTDLVYDAWSNPGKYDDYKKDYESLGALNCHAASFLLSNGFNPTGQNLFMNGEERNYFINEYYTNVSPDQAIFGSTLITHGFAHTSVYFGTDRSGYVYVYTVNGAGASPQIMRQLDLYYNEKYEVEAGMYGPVRDIGNNEANQLDCYRKPMNRYGQIGNGGTGYYNLKKIKR